MSWSCQIPETPHRQLAEAVRNAEVTGQDAKLPYVARATEAAKQVALKLADSGAVGDTEKSYIISLAGHANPDHEPNGNWVNDTISVNVRQA